MTNRPSSVTVTFVFILLNAAIWAGFSILVAAGAHPAMPDAAIVKWGMAGLALLCAGVLAALGIYLRHRNKSVYYLAVVTLAVTAILTITDEFGYADLAVLLITLLPLALLIKDRTWYLPLHTKNVERK